MAAVEHVARRFTAVVGGARSVRFGAVIVVMLAVALLAVGAPPRGVVALVVMIVVPPLSIVVHEAGHALAFELLTGRGDWEIESGRLVAAVLVPVPLRPGPDAVVSASGPMAGVMVSLVAVLAGQRTIGLICLGFHALNLTPVFSDGRRLWRAAMGRVGPQLRR